jgi:hypothetical protein
MRVLVTREVEVPKPISPEALFRKGPNETHSYDQLSRR